MQMAFPILHAPSCGHIGPLSLGMAAKSWRLSAGGWSKWLANKSRCVSGPSLGHESGGREGEMMRRGRGVWQIGEEEKTLMAESGG